ncbi:MAG: 2-octaprenyl-6-methoxyphenyl hydroxylase [Pseudomonadota bacterium]|uniref:2-octaprenyl-6-methoxyphenol hydroxylase /2-octaprenyl-3-methyl-6-methoxy-1,4-benzoquinol hydroxylase n=1 Tax=Gallaecimonas pentaromativorans TaxID=584787 RepID=A0A3N1NUI7_9GAMM|nr:2-octaprenyl-6-methoxyphenyl hydroxylase [Gallaecimonas pentaromativorans]MED5526342.1 2-octaprenyl-6-methoxyphenyl hydroxylase [Pseudomonadota bacterium]ROQ22502.1 2-octaprenyl-6-methoxyphenol hydroxylase /2-octaprenyl-3-methyl-6-methoxy-1,4-benzoquinol hydroxylase [Gallaecimonas pentaromativorans]
MKLDILIVGGGMVGATLAWGLARRFGHWQVGIVEPARFDQSQQPSFDDRVIALSAGSVEGLETMGLWPHLKADAEAIRHIHVAERGGFGRAQIHAADHKVEALGQVIPVRAFGQVLREKLPCQWFCPDRIAHIESLDAGYQVTLASGLQLQCKLLVVADGGQSQTRKLLGIAASDKPYGQSAIIANIKTDKPHQGWAYERFTGTGPLALLPMTEGRMNLVLCVRPEEVEQTMALGNPDFAALLQQRFGWRLGAFVDIGERHCYPLHLIEAASLRAHRAVVLGNAAHSLHPIAGQGFNLGLRDVLVLLESLAPGDPGHWLGLARWEAKRQGDLGRTIATTDLLARLFTWDLTPLYLGRNAGLGLLNHLPMAKRKLAWQMLGWEN